MFLWKVIYEHYHAKQYTMDETQIELKLESEKNSPECDAGKFTLKIIS